MTPAASAKLQPAGPSSELTGSYRMALNVAKLLTSLTVIAVASLLQNAARHDLEDRIKCALGIVIFVASSWGFVALSLEARKRQEAREILAARRYQGVMKRFSEKNGWGLLSVPGHRDARIYRAERDSISLAIGEAIDFRVEADTNNAGWFKAVDCTKIDLSDVAGAQDDDSEEENEVPKPEQNEAEDGKPRRRRKDALDQDHHTEALGDIVKAAVERFDKEPEAVTDERCMAHDNEVCRSNTTVEDTEAPDDEVSKLGGSELNSEDKVLTCLSMSS